MPDGWRQTRARAERTFAEGRQAEALAELRAAESDLLEFLTTNRDVTGSPALVARRERLQREVTMRQTVYTSLRQSYEQSRLEEVRDTPTITVVEDALLPARPDSRKLLQKLVLASAIGLLLGGFLALVLARRGPAMPAREGNPA